MAASAWAVYDQFRHWIGNSTISLSGTTFDLHLGRTEGSADIVNESLTTLGSVLSGTNEVVSGNGYSQSGKAMTVTWTAGDSAGQQRWDMSDVIWTASGGNIAEIRYAIIVARTGASGKDAANQPVMYAPLTTTEFTLNSGSTLTVSTPSGDGIFELSGG